MLGVVWKIRVGQTSFLQARSPDPSSSIQQRNHQFGSLWRLCDYLREVLTVQITTLPGEPKSLGSHEPSLQSCA